VSTNSVAAFTACEAAWVAHFPGCGCASNKTSTEDGKASTIGSEAGALAVHCIDFTMSGGLCQTYTPTTTRWAHDAVVRRARAAGWEAEITDDDTLLIRVRGHLSGSNGP
jgi:hypothetical protein